MESSTYSPVTRSLFSASIAWMLAGLLFTDRFARFIRATIHFFAWTAAALLVCLGGVFGLKQFAIEVNLALFFITVMMFAYWWGERTVRRLVEVLISFCFSLTHGMSLVYIFFIEQLLQIPGRDWLLVGLLSLLVGITLSLIKAGAMTVSRTIAESMNQRLSSWLP